MFCPYCGTSIPEEQRFCGTCGKSLSQKDTATEAAPATPVAPVTPAAPAKKSPVPIFITFALSLVLLIASVLIPLATPMDNVPVISLVMNLAEAGVEDLAEGIGDAIAELELAQGLMPEQQTAAGDLIEKLEKLDDNFSLLNFNSAAKALEEYGSAYMPELEFDEELSAVLSVVIWIIAGAFALPLLFTLLGGLKKSKGLTIVALILTAISQLIFSGFLLLVLSLAVLITQIVLCGKYKKSLQAAEA